MIEFFYEKSITYHVVIFHMKICLLYIIICIEMNNVNSHMSYFVKEDSKKCLYPTKLSEVKTNYFEKKTSSRRAFPTQYFYLLSLDSVKVCDMSFWGM